MSHVLVVDDELQIRRALTTNLRARGFDVDEAVSLLADSRDQRAHERHSAQATAATGAEPS